jgi:hypothetical protein
MAFTSAPRRTETARLVEEVGDGPDRVAGLRAEHALEDVDHPRFGPVGDLHAGDGVEGAERRRQRQQGGEQAQHPEEGDLRGQPTHPVGAPLVDQLLQEVDAARADPAGSGVDALADPLDHRAGAAEEGRAPTEGVVAGPIMGSEDGGAAARSQPRPRRGPGAPGHSTGDEDRPGRRSDLP